MNKQIIKTGWQLLKDNYKGDYDLGTTEYTIVEVDGDNFLLIPGTNETKDWKENFNLTKKDGLKKVGVDAMEEIINHLISIGLTLDDIDYIFCHSKSVPTGVSFAKHAIRMGYEYKVIGFNGARSVKRGTILELDNMIMFRNRFDIVSELAGVYNFIHPKLTKYPTYFNWSFRHYLKHWGKFIEKRVK